MLNKSKVIISGLLAMGVIHPSYAESASYSDVIDCAKEGNLLCQTAVGKAYEEGNGVKQDYVKAKEWYLKSAKKGENIAQYRLGGLYFTGRGVKLDNVKASEWFIKSANQGNINAAFSLASMYYSGKGVKQNTTKAKEWLTKACQGGNDVSCQILKEKF
ncbi:MULTISPECIES: tetratricopeptide repeat protein [unclassified Lonepinella]|uniref:tetratricopeptide repeat protein n=1 Tax=unclassified Lonepinella TaxID=2642006 RepID=UPI003F6E33A4